MNFVAYYRVSTVRQGQSGLGLDAQQEAVKKLITFRQGEILQSFQEVESGANNNRTQLAAAMAYAKAKSATLVVAKLDRLSRDAKFLLTLADGGVPILFGDFPDLDATTPVGRMVLTQMAAVAEFERRRISERIVAALSQAKQRGKKLGGYRHSTVSEATRLAANQAHQEIANHRASELLEVINEIDADGTMSRNALANQLNQRGIPSPSGKGNWTATTVTRLLKRVEAIHEQKRRIAAKSIRSISDRLQTKSRTVCKRSLGCTT
jgi:DNA invertase Pin-like site-specific DNA recombinase